MAIHKIKFFAGRGSRYLAEKIVASYGTTLGNSEVQQFSDGEFQPCFNESIRGCTVFIIQSTFPPLDNLMELLMMIDAARRASAYKVIAVMPYFGWARQDRKDRPRVPIGAKLVANMLVAAGVDRIMTMDLHADQIQGFFDIPVDNMLGNPLFTRYYMSKFDEKLFNHDEFCVVSPDVGSVARSRTFAAKVHMGLAIVDKRRQRANMCEVMNIIGDVEGKTCILFDDIVDTAGSLCNAAEAIKTIGKAKAVYACASHGVLSGNATQRIEDSCIEELMVLNTIPLPADYTGKKIHQLDASPIFAKAITRIYNETSISSLF